MNNNMGTPSLAEEPKKKNSKVIIAIAVAVVLCLCCVVGLGVWWLWNNGDQLLGLGSLLTQVI